MKKVFLYLYPIEEYTKCFIHPDSCYEEYGIEKPFPVLNETIDERYRKNGYEIVYALYPDKQLFGIDKRDTDKIIYTDISFDESSYYDEHGKEKENFIPKYPSEDKLIEQLGDIEELIVGGYHFSDCVKRIAENAYQKGINTLVDMDLTDIFYNVYKQKDYFTIDSYSPERYKEYMLSKRDPSNYEFYENIFKRNYSSPVYGFDFSKSMKY